MIYAFCGSIIGLVMGLTGAGGALVAIPLFMTLLNMKLEVATIYSLVAVVIASLFNFYFQRKNTNYKLALGIIIPSAIGSFITAPLRHYVVGLPMAIMLLIPSIYAIYGMWNDKKRSDNEKPEEFSSKTLLALIITGLILGALTTFTGLGGGVLLVPVFIQIFNLNQKQAISTGLLSVALSSLASLLIQMHKGAQIDININLVFLVVGIFALAFAVKWPLKAWPERRMQLVRKWAFVLVVVFAMAKVFTSL